MRCVCSIIVVERVRLIDGVFFLVVGGCRMSNANDGKTKLLQWSLGS